MTVAELENRIGATELDDWITFYNEEPFGPERDNWHMGVLAALFQNSKRTKKTDKVWSPLHFMYGEKAQQRQRDLETKKTLAALSAMAVKKKKPEGAAP